MKSLGKFFKENFNEYFDEKKQFREYMGNRRGWKFSEYYVENKYKGGSVIIENCLGDFCVGVYNERQDLIEAKEPCKSIKEAYRYAEKLLNRHDPSRKKPEERPMKHSKKGKLPCWEKTGFVTREGAEQTSEMMRRKRGSILNAYKCGNCTKFHLTSK